MQTPLDRAHRRLEFAAHLHQRPATQVESHQRFAVERLKGLQTLQDLGPLLGADQVVERTGVVGRSAG